jgi:hypothetical protein
MAAPALWPAYRLKLAGYARLIRRLYGGIQAASGASLIVDSTKHYASAFFLSRLPGLDLHVVHLVRDSRGVAFSWSKRVARPEAVHRGAYMNCYGPLRTAGRWLGYNAAFEALAHVGVPSTFVRYEDLMRSPEGVMGRILARHDMPPGKNPFPFVRGREVDLRPNHTVAGNPMRFRVGTIRLQADEQWKRGLPAGRRRVVALLTRPLLRRYGYEDGGSGRADRGRTSSARPFRPTATDAAVPAR